mgnify:CR=1 FL=1
MLFKVPNIVKQKFFRDELNIWEIVSKDTTHYYAILDNVKGRSLPITFLAIYNDNGEISIKIDIYYDNYICIDIADNGKGIPRKHKNNIFKPGFSSKKRGWGLGLSLTKRIIEEIHFGKIWLLQSNKGKTIMRTILQF